MNTSFDMKQVCNCASEAYESAALHVRRTEAGDMLADINSSFLLLTANNHCKEEAS